MTRTESFRAVRDSLLASRTDYDGVRRAFEWPRFEEFNFALDWFDAVAATARGAQPAVRIAAPDGSEESLTYGDLSRRSSQAANLLREAGVARGDRILLVAGNCPPLWETMLAAIKLGAVVIPATTLLSARDLADRVARGGVSCVIAQPDQADKVDGLDAAPRLTRVLIGDASRPGWIALSDARSRSERFVPDGPTRASDPLLIYFTSGTTAAPKLVEHTHASYPVGHLSTLYWLGLQPGDVHLNISSPGWAKHAWSCFFTPFIAEATVFISNYERFDARSLLDQMQRAGVTTFCAPPTVWRMLVQQDLTSWDIPLREVLSAGEPLNPEIIAHVERVWGKTIRDGYGQSETTALVGNPPGQAVVPGSMGRPLPGYDIALLDVATGRPADDGEICIRLDRAPVGVMTGYRDDGERTAAVMRDGHYHTGDIASRDEAGYLTYVGRTDDVFKASDYRISPFELESVLVEHPAVVEAAVVPSPDPLRLAVPKAYIVLAEGYPASPDTARAIFEFTRASLAPYKRIRRLEFTDLPRTVSGKIRRVHLRELESAHDGVSRRPDEFREDDFADQLAVSG